MNCVSTPTKIEPFPYSVVPLHLKELVTVEFLQYYYIRKTEDQSNVPLVVNS